MKNLLAPVCLVVAFSTTTFSQEKSVDTFDPQTLNWYNLDLVTDGTLGASVNKAYSELIAGKPSRKTVVVAVIDGGIDINHEDLQGRIWVNQNEIPNNNVDDDGNGYTDDLHGWNFIGNADGTNVHFENYEHTRVVRKGLNAKDYNEARKEYEEELKTQQKRKETLTQFEKALKKAVFIIKENTGIVVNNAEDLGKVEAKNESVAKAVAFLDSKFKLGFTFMDLEKMKDRNTESLEKHLSLVNDYRMVVGDNPDDINDSIYGNNDVIGPRADHGTCTAGIIAAVRGNGIGVDGVATNVKIMVLRVVPNGDERDKDVALAIRYAVNNGADIINMSFGKRFSPHPEFVEDAVRYAEKKNVLIVHSAGNEANNIDEVTYYPSNTFSDNTKASNFIIVGASEMKKDKSTACIFSNYGKEEVDVFAPGKDIVALDTNNQYSQHSGTSQAGPVVAGVAAVLLSYHPELTPQQIITIINESATDLKKQKIMIPNLTQKKRKKTRFQNLCKSGGIVNLYQALKNAETTL